METSTRKSLQGLNSFTDTFSQSFKEALVADREQGFQVKPTRSDKKKGYVRYTGNVIKKMKIKKYAAVVVLTQDESLRGYNRKRKLQFFESNPPKK